MIADPFPSDPLGQRLCSIFSYPWMSLEGSTEDATNPNWRTITKYPIRPRSQWKKWLDPKVLIGMRFGSTTQYGLIDIDAGSKFDNPEGIAAIQGALETIGITRTIVIKSSWSDGHHIYLPLPEEVPTFDLACAIRYTLAAAEIYLEPGQVEAFPNTRAFIKGKVFGIHAEYHGHRLPLQPGTGSALRDHNLNPTTTDLAAFFTQWDYCTRSQDMEALAIALEQGRECHRKRPKKQRSDIEDWRKDWQLEINEGWTGPSQTNALLRVIAGYGRVFEGLEGQDLAAHILHTAINCPGFEEHCRHQIDIESRAVAWAHAAEGFYWPLGAAPQPREKSLFDRNDEKALDAQSRIKAAYQWLIKQGQWPTTVTAQLKALCQKARTSFKTLYKYSSLWRQPERCVTDRTERDRSDPPPNDLPTSDPPKPAPPQQLHTSIPITKGGGPVGPLLKSFNPDSWGLDRGPGKGGGFPQAAGGC